MYIPSDYDKDEAPVNRPNHFNQCKADYISFSCKVQTTKNYYYLNLPFSKNTRVNTMYFSFMSDRDVDQSHTHAPIQIEYVSMYDTRGLRKGLQ